MGRKDRERFLRLRGENPGYAGFRGADTVTARAPSAATETVVCPVCNRKRNVASGSLPEDHSAYVCLSCRKEDAGGP